MESTLPPPTIGDALAARAREQPGAPALAFPLSGGKLTYGEWWDRSRAVAAALVRRGVVPGDHVALLAENRLEWPLVQMAVALAGAVLVPLNTHYTRDELRFALDQSRARGLFLSPTFRSHDYLAMVRDIRRELPALADVIVFGPASDGCLAFDDLLAPGPDVRLPEPRPGDIGSLQYTSGTTGFPKGALLTHEGMLLVARVTAARLGVGPEDRWTSIIPLFHCAGCIMNVLGCVQTGACYVGVPWFEAESMFRVIAEERCTLLSGVPTSYLAMLGHPRRGEYDLRTLRAGTCGGADVDGELLRRCAEAFPIPGLVQVYGQTESCTLVACPPVDDRARFDTAGPPIDGCEVRVTDPETRAVLPAGRVGQIEARGPIVMAGYFDRPDATAEALDGDGWLRTGDLGRLDEKGYVVMAGGRLRDMIIRGGENVYPIEVENLLLGHPAVAQAAVFGVPDAYYGEVVAAAVTLSADVGAGDLSDFCAGRIARYKMPARWYRVDTLPMTSSGKIRKVALQALCADGRLEVLQ